MRPSPALLLLGAAGAPLAAGLNNGLGLTPLMGFSSWNAFSSNVSSAVMRNITRILIESGLAAKGYNHINIDEGWLKSRNSSGWIVEDFVKFPEGMDGFGAWVHSQELSPGSGQYFKYGLYSCRGTCQCSEWDYHGPGSQGYEANDINWMVKHAGADFLKIDSCCGSQDHKTAFGQYGLWRDLINATGKPVFFSACGWEEWYAPPDPSVGYAGGYSLANSWRIAGDGDTWPALTNCFNTIARTRQYAGPGGWNDPDLLIGPNGIADGTYATDLQARTQFNLWSVLAAPLVVSNNLMEASDYYMETLGNEEVIAVDQDPAGVPGYRVVGSDLAYPCTTPAAAVPFTVKASACDPSGKEPAQLWTSVPNPNGDGTHALVLASTAGGSDPIYAVAYGCDSSNGAPVYGTTAGGSGGGSCGGKNAFWTVHASAPGATGTITPSFAPGSCLDVYNSRGPVVDVWTCNGGSNQAWTWTAAGQLQSAQPSSQQYTPLCLTAVPAADTCTNVWGRPLADGSVAFAFVNNDGANNLTVTCDGDCFGALNLTAATAPRGLAIRDLWAHAVVANLSAPFSWSATVQAGGGSAIVRAIPL